MADGSVSVELSIDEQKALRALTSLSKRFEEFGNEAASSFKKSDLALASFAGNLGSNLVSKGFSLMADGFKAIVGSVGEVISAASEQQKTLNELNTALALSGRYSKKASEDFQAFASSIQNSTGIGDDAIVALGARIQTIARLTEKELQRATLATVDLSAALGIDLDSAGRMVAKAIEGNVTAFNRYGIQIQKAKDEGQQFNNVMNALSAFAGTAESKLNTFAGISGAVGERIGDLRESLGLIIIENPAVIASLQGLSKGLVFLTDLISKNKGAINEFIVVAVQGLVESLKSGAEIFAFFNKGFAGFEITGKIFQQSLFGIDIALSKFNLGLDYVISKIQEYTGLDLGAGQKAFIQSQEESIKFSQEQIAAIDGEINALMNRTTAQNNAAKNFADVVVTETNRAIQEQNILQQQGNDQYLINLSNKNIAEQEAIITQNEAVKLLQDAQLMSLRTAQSDYEMQKQLNDDANFQFLVANLGKEEALREVARAQELQRTAGQNAAVLSLKAARTKAEQNQIFAFQKWEDLSNKQRLDNLKSTLSVMSSLQSSSSKELFAIGKASALSIATIDGIQAVQKALASAPPPFNYALAAAVGIAQAANLAKIASAKPPGMENGGIVGGGSYFGDKIPMNLNSREMVLNRQQQTKLFNDINSGGTSGNVIEAINNLGERISNMKIVVQANSREIARLVRDEKQAGFIL